MNIFYLDKDPKICAQQHADKHVVKMILEYAQMMSTAHHILNPESVTNQMLYKPTHRNHPSAVWVRQSRENYLWVSRLWIELINEYKHRYGKNHATEQLAPYLVHAPYGISESSFTPPPPAMDKEYIVSDDSIINYRNYYIKAKTRLLKYTNREVPYWVKEEINLDKNHSKK